MFNFSKQKSKKKTLINGFDEQGYLEANLDVKEAIEKGDFKSGLEHLEIAGLEEIREGKRKFHPDFEPFNEEKYLELFPDVKKAVEDGAFKSGFEHFCLYGYEEIIKGYRSWDIFLEPLKSFKENELILVFGVPRSGITLTTYLLSFNKDYTIWFLPFSTRKKFGIPYFDKINTIKKEYKKVFPNKEVKDKFILSESTANSDVFEWLENGIFKSNLNYQIIWMFRNINESFLSLKEAARKYWGDNEDNINFENYKNYIEFVRNSFFNTFKLFIKNSQNVHCFTLSNVIKGNLNKFYNLQIDDFKLNFNKFSIAGDPSFLEKNNIDLNVLDKRKNVWEQYKHFYNELEDKDKKFVDFYNELVNLIEKVPNILLEEIINKYAVEYFDKDFYLSQYDDIKQANVNPYEHYMNFGFKEGRNPNEFFVNVSTEYIDNIHSYIYHIFIGQFKEEHIKISDDDIYGKLELKIIDPEKYEINDNLKLKAPKFKNPKVSIIIPAYNQHNYTLACIESIIKHTNDVSYEIIVMDDKSPDPKAQEIEKYLENIIFVSNGINYGFLENCNKGANIAKGEYILFLNNDTNVQPNWLKSLVDLIESDPKIGMVGSKLVYPNGQQQEAGGIVWKDASAWNFRRLDHPLKPECNYVKECDYISGAAIMIKKDLWDEIGGFDVRYKPAYFEDTDLAFEVRKHGYKVMLQPKSIVVHFEGISHGTDISQGIKSYQVKNREKFIEKWKDILEKEQFPNGEHVFLARDRSGFKKHILFIDHYLPHFDQDAGSRTVYQYIKFFVKNNFQVHFIGDNFWHYPGTPYLEALEQLGVEVLYGAYYANHRRDWLKENGKYFDYVFLNRPHISIKYIDEVKKFTNAKIIYYGHDLHFLRLQKEYEITKSDKVLKELEHIKNIEMNLMKKSDVVLYPSYLEREAIKQIDKSINVFDVPAYLFDDFSINERKIEKTADLMFVGGFSHAPNVDAVKWFVKDIFPIIKKEIPEIKFYIIGSNPPDEISNLNNEKDIIVTGYINDEELLNFYKNCRVSVVPLRYGGGVKGKVVEALYHNIPVVTTSVGSEGLIGVENYLIIEDEAEKFAKAVIKIYNDINMLKRYSKGREYCKNNFSDLKIKEIFSKFIEFGAKK